MSEWIHAHLGDVATIRSGGTPSKRRPDYWGGDIPWISAKTLHDTRISDSDLFVTDLGLANGSSVAEPGASLILVRGMSLIQEIRVGFVTQRVAFNQDVKAIEAGPNLLPTFLNFTLRAARPTLLAQVHLAGHGTGVLATDRLQRLPIRLPPLSEQERIVAVLGAFDDLIETNRRVAEDLDALIALTVSDALRSSKVKIRLTTIASFVNGRNFTKGADGSGRPVIRTPEVRSGPQARTVRNSLEVEDADRLARPGDLLFVWSGTLMVNRWRHEEGLVNQHVFKVIPHGVPSWYVYSLIQAQMAWFLGLAKDKATTMGHIRRADLDEPLTGLSEDEIARLDAAIAPLWDASLQLQMEADELTTQRDELLPLLMSGKVRVSELKGVV